MTWTVTGTRPDLAWRDVPRRGRFPCSGDNYGRLDALELRSEERRRSRSTWTRSREGNEGGRSGALRLVRLPGWTGLSSTVRGEILRNLRDDLRVCELVGRLHCDGWFRSRRRLSEPIRQLLFRFTGPKNQ